METKAKKQDTKLKDRLKDRNQGQKAGYKAKKQDTNLKDRLKDRNQGQKAG